MNEKDVDINAINTLPEKISSFNILSQILPPISLKYKNKQFKEGEDFKTSNNVLKLNNGELFVVILRKAFLEINQKELFNRICNDWKYSSC